MNIISLYLNIWRISNILSVPECPNAIYEKSWRGTGLSSKIGGCVPIRGLTQNKRKAHKHRWLKWTEREKHSRGWNSGVKAQVSTEEALKLEAFRRVTESRFLMKMFSTTRMTIHFVATVTKFCNNSFRHVHRWFIEGFAKKSLKAHTLLLLNEI